MKKLLLIVLIASPLFSQAINRENRRLLKQLDSTIRNKEAYVKQKYSHIDSLKQVMENSSDFGTKASLAQQICFDYSTLEKDSALLYALKMDQYASHIGDSRRALEARIDHARMLCSMGFFQEAVTIFKDIDRSQIPESLTSEYMLSQITLLDYQKDFASNQSERSYYNKVAQTYRDSLLKMDDVPDNIRVFTKAGQLLIDQQYDLVIDLLDSALLVLHPYSRDGGIIAYSMGWAYLEKNELQNAIKYFTISSIADLRNGVREYISLRKLAKIMLEEGDVDRAYTYMRCAMEDAILCNAKLSTLEASDMFMLIEEAFQQKSQRNRLVTNVMLVLATMFAITTLLMLLKIGRQNRNIEMANEALNRHLTVIEKINGELKDSSVIKEQYVGLYMEQYANYITKITSFRKKALKIARTDSLESVVDFLNSSLNTEEQLKEFYQNFDTTILNLFPDFVEQFNDLLATEHRIELKHNDLITPELRIFALVRLGIDDSVKIAHFLQYSLSTIYNYRTKMRNNARGDRNEFEINVRQIGK